MCLDSRVVNEGIEHEHHRLPTICELVSQLNDSKYFQSVFKLRLPPNWVRMNEGSRYITMSATHHGLYYYKRFCLGINSTAKIYQKAVSDIIRDLTWVFNISDDIFIYAETKEEHDAKVTKVLQRMWQYNVIANKSKCEFGVGLIYFCCCIFSSQGTSVSKILQAKHTPQMTYRN